MKATTRPEPAPARADPASPRSYLDLYGLSKPPFGATPEHGGYILFGSQRRAFELVIEHVVNGSGVIMLQGEEGVGKTETLRSVASVTAESGLQTIVVFRPANGRVDLSQLLSTLRGQSGAGEVTTAEATSTFMKPPRKALLADDIDLMPADCLSFLLSLAQAIPAGPSSPSFVFGTSTAVTADPKRPELSELASLASNTVRMTRLGAAEIQQYIERSLWIAGGTTRRLIATDAMKLVISRSGGAPGVTNRLMEAVLTAGFARGDSMITAKTIAAVMGPTAPRPRQRAGEPSGTAARMMQIAATGLLVLGAAAFLYRGFSDQSSTASLPPSTQSGSATSSAETPAVKPPETLPPELMAALMKRGDQTLGLGDVAAARLLYQRAAEAGNGSAAIALGKTYDPNFAAPGGKPDPRRAAEWYRRAIALSDRHATDLLKRLGSGPGH